MFLKSICLIGLFLWSTRTVINLDPLSARKSLHLIKALSANLHLEPTHRELQRWVRCRWHRAKCAEMDGAETKTKQQLALQKTPKCITHQRKHARKGVERAHTLRPPVNASHYNTCLDPFCVAASIEERERKRIKEKRVALSIMLIASGSDCGRSSARGEKDWRKRSTSSS
jgi:hypothetical protein